MNKWSLYRKSKVILKKKNGTCRDVGNTQGVWIMYVIVLSLLLCFTDDEK